MPKVSERVDGPAGVPRIRWLLVVGGILALVVAASPRLLASATHDPSQVALASPLAPSLATPLATASVTTTLAPPSPMPSPTPTPTPAATATVTADPTLAPLARLPVDVRLVADPKATFASEARKDWCAPAAVQMVLAIRQRADTTTEVQAQLAGRIDEWSTWEDSHNGGWGPAAMASAIGAYGISGYTVVVYQTRAAALRGAAAALSRTGAPVILLAWRGAHAWVMHGFRADADPLAFDDASVTGVYVMDPWYPRVSTLWGRSDPPGTLQDQAEMVRNFLPWQRPEGRYPDRDGRFVVVQPSLVTGPAG